MNGFQGLCLAFQRLFSQSNPIEPKNEPTYFVDSKGTIGFVLQKKLFLPLPSPRKLYKRLPARFSLAEIPGATKLFRKFRIFRIFRKFRKGSAGFQPARAVCPQALCSCFIFFDSVQAGSHDERFPRRESLLATGILPQVATGIPACPLRVQAGKGCAPFPSAALRTGPPCWLPACSELRRRLTKSNNPNTANQLPFLSLIQRKAFDVPKGWLSCSNQKRCV